MQQMINKNPGRKKKDAPTPQETPFKNDLFFNQNDNISNIKSQQGHGRSRTWATILYADSANPKWKEILAELAIPCFVSPYHDQDVNPYGEPKKPHWHVLFMFDGVKSLKQIQDISKQLCSVGQENVASTRGYARYLCHLDNPEKTQYNIDDVLTFGGADYRDVISLPSDKYIVIGEMMDFCDKYDVKSLYALMKYARKNKEDWMRALSDNCGYIMREWLESRKWSIEHGFDKIVDSETGEMIL